MMERRRPASDQGSGFALVAVIIVVTMLSLSAYTLAHWLALEAEGAELETRRFQARMSAASAGSLLEALAGLTPLDSPVLSDSPDLFQGIVLEADENDSEKEAERRRVTVLSPSRVEGFTDANQPPIRFGVEREGGRIHLNAWFAKNPAALRAALLKLPLATDELVDALLDWLDADSDPRPNGAESEHYSVLPTPIAVRNGPVESIEELLLVRGITPAILFGEDTNQNGVLDPNEDDGDESAPLDDHDGKLDRGWSAYLTLWSREANVDSAGRPRIYLNDQDLGRLYSQVSQAFDVELARFVVAYRVVGPRVASPAPATVAPSPSPTAVVASPGSFTFRSVYDLVDAEVSGTWEGEKVELRSPIQSADATALGRLDAVADRLTAVPEPSWDGRVDLISATSESLSLLPLTDPQREAILDQRPLPVAATGPAGQVRRTASPPPSLYWLVTSGVLTREQLVMLERDVTQSSPVIRFQAVGFSDRDRSATRLGVVMDRSVSPPVMRSCQVLDRFGAGFPREWLGKGSETKSLPNWNTPAVP